eukprot:TRINITY_DN6334_c0_g1_i2.p3 TRINITY_DN6334_c0_g1~~TRINITY_DN6334_c0_g1_i2.p3  ORF type:complete len:122 (+),score=4.05 TRINITY_DN6334_c0_g1_i2:51-416(+)
MNSRSNERFDQMPFDLWATLLQLPPFTTSTDSHNNTQFCYSIQTQNLSSEQLLLAHHRKEKFAALDSNKQGTTNSYIIVLFLTKSGQIYKNSCSFPTAGQNEVFAVFKISKCWPVGNPQAS